MPRAAAWSTVLAGSVLVAACSGATAPEPAPRPEPALTLGLTQILPEEGSNRVLLRVINSEGRPVTVTAVGLSWPGYGEVLEPTDGEKVVPAGSELMLRLELPAARCTPDPASRQVLGRLVVDGQEMTRELTAPAQVYVERLWRAQCDKQLLRRSLRIRYADEARVVSGPQGHRVETALVLTRLDANRDVHIGSTGGSVLYDIEVPSGATLPTGLGATRLPLAILPGNRCDEHAIGQATAPFDFSLTLRLGDRRILHMIRPPLKVQSAASKMLLRHCGGRPD